MRDLIGLEFKKFRSQKSHWFILILFCFLVGYDIHTKLNQQVPIAQYIDQQVINDGYQIRSKFSEVRAQISEYPDNKKFVQMLEWIQEDMNHNMDMGLTIVKQDWPAYLKSHIASDTLRLNHLEETKTFQIWYESERELRENIAVDTLLLEQNITPMNTEQSMEGYNFLVLFMSSGFLYVMFALCVYFTSALVPSDFETGTYKLLFTQPISKTKILCSKIISAVLLNVTWVSLLIGSCFVYATSKCGMGNPNYPIRFFINGTESFIPMKQFVLIALVILFLMIMIITLLTICFSVYLKHSTLAFIVSGGMIVMCAIIPLQGIMPSLAQFNPFSYLRIVDSLKGNTAVYLNLDLRYGILGFIILSGVLIVISLRTFKYQKQDS